MAEAITIATPKGNIAALAFGPTSGQPVLALHGWLDNATSFMAMARALPPNTRLVAIEFPGHGHSDHRPEGHRYELVEYVEDVLGVVDALGWYRFALIGHSLGAVVAGLLAGTFPERLSAMVWIDAIGPYVNQDHEAPSILRRSIEQRRRERSEGRLFASIDEAATARMKGFSPLAPESARLLAERNLEAVAGGFRWRTDVRLREPSMQRMNERQVKAYLSAIVCPTLLIYGSRGLALVADKSPRPSYVKGLETRQLEGGHHLHMEDAADAVAHAAFEFLATHTQVGVVS